MLLGSPALKLYLDEVLINLRVWKWAWSYSKTYHIFLEYYKCFIFKFGSHNYYSLWDQVVYTDGLWICIVCGIRHVSFCLLHTFPADTKLQYPSSLFSSGYNKKKAAESHIVYALYTTTTTTVAIFYLLLLRCCCRSFCLAFMLHGSLAALRYLAAVYS